MKKLEEVNINGEKIYLRKDFLGWHTINPIQKDKSILIYDKANKKFNWNNINWKNLISGGSWIKLGIALGFTFILIMAIFEVSKIYQVANECLKLQVNPWLK
jgi:hypothetical protein